MTAIFKFVYAMTFFISLFLALVHVDGARFGIKDEFKEAINNYAIYNMTCLKRFKN
ncbi:Nodule Cysteine-Rich (NCR) secreted peptide [Medicago truncatula]|uniref:Nodule Cysteine-Rich (NCR) secreted peptide n=1 Tax=Medicago truncatula TaxID=3880 RepID=A0A072UL33_MEDTR|nr:Nodule Cysteine-Rich (NCR) secreted peptide [Medicago truncatula]